MNTSDPNPVPDRHPLTTALARVALAVHELTLGELRALIEAMELARETAVSRGFATVFEAVFALCRLEYSRQAAILNDLEVGDDGETGECLGPAPW